jgi:hypothetical protein
VRTIDGTWVISGFVTVLMIWVLSACGGQNVRQEPVDGLLEQSGQDSEVEPVMVFDTLEHDFGTIIEGERVVCYFDYINGGGKELLITSVEASCGCTTPGWSSEPLKPGECESLELIFDATGRSGVQRKVVTVLSNASNQVVRLTIKANIINSV